MILWGLMGIDGDFYTPTTELMQLHHRGLCGIQEEGQEATLTVVSLHPNKSPVMHGSSWTCTSCLAGTNLSETGEA